MLEGFTLFRSSKGWQLSIKRVGVDGWSVRHIPESHAKTILAEVEGVAGHHIEAPAPSHKRRVLVLED
jgi:hypothetical protein